MTAVLAIDLGAESGRVTRVAHDGERLRLGASHRFPNQPVAAGGVLHWDALRLWREMLDGLRAVAGDGTAAASVGVDAFGLDFALLDGGGRVVAGPVHHRDGRRLRGLALAEERVGRAALYRATGIRVMPVNGLFELVAMAADGDGALAGADRLAMVADLFHLWLSGTAACEWTLATTSGATAPEGGWARELLEALGIPTGPLGEIVPPGTRLGPLRDDVAAATGLAVPAVITPASHDTASAVVAIPFAGPDAAYISSGTWSLMGVETDAPVLSPAAEHANLSNEGGVGGRNRLQTNIAGLWLLQECRRRWVAEGRSRDYGELVALAAAAPPLASVIDVDHPSLLAPGDMPARIRRLCAATGEPVPETTGAVVRCVLESLALAYRSVLADLEEASGRPLRAIHVVGGGARNRALCQWTADACGVPVIAGPVEATTYGNAIVQLIALGELAGVDDGRRAIAASVDTVIFEPAGGSGWDAAAARLATRRARAPTAA